jgi:hypothetical protein
VPTAFDGPSHSHLTMSEEVYSIRGRGGWGKGETGGQPMPVPFPDPSGGCGWVSSVGPAAEFCPRELIEPAVDGLAHASAVRVRPPRIWGLSWRITSLWGKAFARGMLRPSSASGSWRLAWAGVLRVWNPRRWP